MKPGPKPKAAEVAAAVAVAAAVTEAAVVAEGAINRKNIAGFWSRACSKWGGQTNRYLRAQADVQHRRSLIATFGPHRCWPRLGRDNHRPRQAAVCRIQQNLPSFCFHATTSWVRTVTAFSSCTSIPFAS